jgi:outer membrane protein OmpA-like peptidoglycan-associated protein
MEKGNRKSLFWTSYSDLMSSLFFTLLVLFVVAIIAMGLALKKANDLQIATQNEINKIRNIENSIQNINKTWFEYNEQYKKHILKIDVSFPRGKADITHIPLEKREDLYNAGLAIDKFLKKAATEYGESVKYLLIIEGQASNDGFAGNFDLSYQRALSLYKYLEENRNLDLKRDNCEVLICGSGTQGTMRSYPDNAWNANNQRFLIHILPKPGIIE